MSTRDERRRARRMAAATVQHWMTAAQDIENRYYAAMRLADLPDGPHVPSEIRQCRICQQDVAIDKHLIPLADRSKGIVCNPCVARETGRPWKSIMMDQLNMDNKGEL